VFELKRFLE